uniref:SH3 domain-containing protein n=1 Tax=Caenorhabditis tropicalis TaxID=1561998 RepID=A0A1I7UD24_9PELO
MRLISHTSTFSVSAAKALFEAAKKPEVRNAAIAAAKNPFVRQTAKNVAQDEKARGAVLNAYNNPSGGNKFNAAMAVAGANRKAEEGPPPPPHRGGGATGSGGGGGAKLSAQHSAIRSQLENMHLGGGATSSSYSNPAPSSYSTPSSQAPPPVPRHTKTTTTVTLSTPHGIAKFDYSPMQSDEMALRVGDTVLLSKKVDAEWFYGENQQSRAYGIVPSSYLDIKIPLKEAFSAPPPSSSSSSSGGTIATAIYDYNSTEYGDLNFSAGSQITITARVNEEWLEGEYYGSKGIFPAQFVDCPNLYQVPLKKATPLSQAPPPTATVSYDYDSGVATDLRLYEGDVITVIEDIDGQWLFAECRGRQGMVPKNFLGPPYGSPKKTASKGIAEIASAFSPKRAVATGDYHSEDPKHLYVTRGDHLLIVEDVDDYYFKGKLEAFKTLPAGILPKNIVKLEN